MDPLPPIIEPKKSWISMHKVLGIVFLVAALAAIVSGIYYWQIVRSIPDLSYAPIVHKDPTAGWQTYTNSQYGFEFKYPGQYSVQQVDSPYLYELNMMLNGDDNLYFSINPDTLSNLIKKNDLNTLGYKSLAIEGHDAIQWYDAGNAPVFLITDIADLNYTYQLEYAGADSPGNLSLYNQILSTLKFTSAATEPEANGPCPVGKLCR